MELGQILTLAAELVGTVAFALSGAFLALENKLDLFGIVFLSLITAVGGGIMRDLILGITPPAVFVHAVYLAVALGATLFVIFASSFKRVKRFFVGNGYLTAIISVSDAIGLGIFTLVGMNSAILLGFYSNTLLTVFVGVVTGIGGGMMRDVLIGRTPLVLRREIYAVASIAGGLCFYLLNNRFTYGASMVASVILIVVIRLASLHLNWNLPTFSDKD